MLSPLPGRLVCDRHASPNFRRMQPAHRLGADIMRKQSAHGTGANNSRRYLFGPSPTFQGSVSIIFIFLNSEPAAILLPAIMAAPKMIGDIERKRLEELKRLEKRVSSATTILWFAADPFQRSSSFIPMNSTRTRPSSRRRRTAWP